MNTVLSKDGTTIAYEQTGQGPVIILVNGALASRNFYGEIELATLLAEKYSCIWFDRRGRGDSTDMQPYSVQKEIEDIATLLDAAGGKAFLYGCSSGAVLALRAAGKLGPEKIEKLALYEPPFTEDTVRFAEGKNKVNELIAAGKPGDAVAAFMEIAGLPPDELAKMKQSPDWKEMERLAPTLRYDYEVLGDGQIPVAIAKNIAMPTLIMNGEKGGDTMQQAADSLQEIISRASSKTLKDQTHEVSPQAMAPMLIEFFK